MPFGLTNDPAVFQGLVSDVLLDLLYVCVFMYMDDILIFSRSKQEHVLHVHQVIQRLLENRLFVKAEQSHTSEVFFLGFIINTGNIQMDLAKTRVVTDWSTRKELHCFLGFIQNYSLVAAPLTVPTSQNVPFWWFFTSTGGSSQTTSTSCLKTI